MVMYRICWFDPWLSQCSFQRLMIVIVTGSIPLSPLSVDFDNDYVEKQPVAWKKWSNGEKNPMKAWIGALAATI